MKVKGHQVMFQVLPENISLFIAMVGFKWGHSSHVKSSHSSTMYSISYVIWQAFTSHVKSCHDSFTYLSDRTLGSFSLLKLYA